MIFLLFHNNDIIMFFIFYENKILSKLNVNNKTTVVIFKLINFICGPKASRQQELSDLEINYSC